MADPVNEIVKEIPFAELVRQSALAIADGQTALDINSAQTAQTLADMKLDPDSVILSLIEETDDDGNVTNVETVTNDAPLSLLAYGITPTFYEFAETEIDLRFWVRWYTREQSGSRSSDFSRDLETKLETSQRKFGGGGGVSLSIGPLSLGGRAGGSRSQTNKRQQTSLTVKTHTEYDSQVYGLSANAACRLNTRLVPKPAPSGAVPNVIRAEPDQEA
ncbi:hypothetical protein [Halalkalirubrum salinum]|uniref:hypothetical protein n=1 Tax=Halalkalirubrum salinum TaxID=2563889 RepID=UPI0010BF7F3E|nr:hypothetical protein [Halalkalirubrum salinum]